MSLKYTQMVNYFLRIQVSRFKYEIYLQVIIKFSYKQILFSIFKLNSGHFCCFRVMALPIGGQIYFMEIHQGSRQGVPRRYFQ